IINVPKRGIGDATVQQLHQAARTLGVSMFETAARLVETDELKPKMRTTLRQLVGQFDHWRSASVSHMELAQMVLDESGYTDMWKQDKSPETQGRLENLKELVNAMGEFETLEGFLEYVSLVMDANEGSSTDMVSIMTLHGAKGLEFNTIFLPGWEEGVFPGQRSLEESGLSGLEEERRLAYVGLTRARVFACITHAARRMVRGLWSDSIPSRFIGEIPAQYAEVETGTPAYGGFGDLGRWGGGYKVDPPRMGTRSSPGLLEGVSYRVQARPAQAEGAFTSGMRVFHEKFGAGQVMAVEGDKLDIAFDRSGRKKVMAGFVRVGEGE
ncbi:MAG: DNA helicase II, partial [Pseudomonadota bacterium]|nr:DNA helicase II [Pseudomonadota bacterium]